MYLFITKHEITFYTLFAKINENAKISVFSHLKFIFILFFFYVLPLSLLLASSLEFSHDLYPKG